MTWLRGVLLALAALALALLLIRPDTSIVHDLGPSVIEIALTAAIIDWLFERQRRRDWQKVRLQVTSGLSFHVANIATHFLAKLYGPGLDLLRHADDISGGFNTPATRTSTALEAMVSELMNVSRDIPWLDTLMEQTEDLYQAIQWDMAEIRNVLLPRMLATAIEGPNLPRLLGDLDAALRDWELQRLLQREISAGDPFFSGARLFLRASANVYAYLVEHGEHPARGRGRRRCTPRPRTLHTTAKPSGDPSRSDSD
jgi:hypothetical protein